MTTAPNSFFSRCARRMLRAAFYAFSALIWLIVIAAAMEAFEQVRGYLSESRYKAYYNEQNAKVYRMVSEEDLRKSDTQFTPSGKEDVFAPNAPAPAVPVTEDAENARKTYAAQSEEHLDVILALQDDLLLEFDREGNFVASHGDPLLESMLVPPLRIKSAGYAWPGWLDALSAVKTATAPVTMDCELQKNELLGITFLYKITVTPLVSPDGSIQRVQLLFHDVSPPLTPERLTSNFPSGGDETPWAISNYMYKRNWSRPNSFFSYNNFGFRDRDFTVPKPAGVIRIVCIGGSTTEEGNSNERTYPHLLQTKLRAWLGTDRVEVLNCGICGGISSFERMRMPDFLALQPDLILHYNAINDIYRCDFPVWLKDTGGLQGLLGKSKFMARYFNRRYLPPDEQIIRQLQATSFRNIKAMNYAAREKGVEMACCSFASPTISPWDFRNRNYLDMDIRHTWYGKMVNFNTYRQLMSLYNRLLKDTCTQEGIHYVPVAENMNAGMDHFLDACHVTPVGMELKVNIIGAYVKDYVQRRLAETPQNK